MTEDEAKTKWCCGPPAMVNQTINHAAGNTNKEPLKCIGSACMAFRKVAPLEMGDPYTVFCGLAGRP